MAYNEFFSQDIEKMLRWSVKSEEITPILAKDLKTKGSVELFCNTVCRPIRESRYCIVDLTYDNTSVGYEWALAEKFEKPVIATLYKPKIRKVSNDVERKCKDKLKEKGIIKYPAVRKEVPADFRGLYIIKYTNKNTLKDELKKHFDVEEA
ncbi:MAG: hypothetical protein O8C63_02385 [Candidatus Methanoperedens sp.]|nr:hypothetical protein [Candidatus Methanoperedens sp.]